MDHLKKKIRTIGQAIGLHLREIFLTFICLDFESLKRDVL